MCVVTKSQLHKADDSRSPSIHDNPNSIVIFCYPYFGPFSKKLAGDEGYR